MSLAGYVLDTNVLVSAALGDGNARRLLVRLAERGLLVTSRPLLDELAEVLARPPFRGRLPPSTAAGLVAAVERYARLVEPAPVDWPENPSDAIVVGTALAAEAVLVSGDKLVLGHAERFGARVATLRAASETLGS